MPPVIAVLTRNRERREVSGALTKSRKKEIMVTKQARASNKDFIDSG